MAVYFFSKKLHVCKEKDVKLNVIFSNNNNKNHLTGKFKYQVNFQIVVHSIVYLFLSYAELMEKIMGLENCFKFFIKP